MGDREVDVLVVGGGPAGLTAATALARAGVRRVEVVDREPALGGIPRHSHHSGYGLRDLHRVMTGPRYAATLVEQAEAAGVVLRPGVTVTGPSGQPLSLETLSRAGIDTVLARAVVLATGARERPRPARLVPGTRPAGIYTTGQLQQAVYEFRQPVGTRAVIVGAEHVSYSALTTLAHAGVAVVAMVTEHERSQTYLAFRAAAAIRYRTTVRGATRVARIVGRGRVTGIELVDAAGRTDRVECDTVVFTGDWIPDHELARRSGVELDDGTRGPAVDAAFRTSVAGVFAVGNLVHPVVTADVAALDGRQVTGAVTEWLADGGARPPDGVPLRVSAPLRWVSPNVISPNVISPGVTGAGVIGAASPARDAFVVWSADFVRRPCFEVRQGSRLLHRETHRRTLIPQRPHNLAGSWTARVDLAAGPVDITAT